MTPDAKHGRIHPKKPQSRKSREQAALALLKGIGAMDAPLQTGGENGAAQPVKTRKIGRWDGRGQPLLRRWPPPLPCCLQAAKTAE